MSSDPCTDNTKLQVRKPACGPPCCEPILCFVETKACHASQHKNGFRQNTHNENNVPLNAQNEPLKYYLRSQRTLTFSQSCKSPTTWRCFRGLAVFRCFYGERWDNSDTLNASHTIWKSDGGRAGCEAGSLTGGGSSRSGSSTQKMTGGFSIGGWPCGYTSFRGGAKSDSQTTKAYGEAIFDWGPGGILKTQTTTNSSGPPIGCYEPASMERHIPDINAVYNTNESSENYSRKCWGTVNVVSWRYCPKPDDPPDAGECFGLNYTVDGNGCSEWGRQEISLGALAGHGHINFRDGFITKPGSKITATCITQELSACSGGSGKGSGTGEGNNNRQGPWTPNQEPDGDGAGTTGWGGQGENGGGQSTDGKPQNLPYQSSAFPPLQGAQNSPASTTTATQQKPWTQPIPPTSQHPPNFHDAYVTGGRPTYPIHGGSSPTSGGGNSSNWSGTWGSTVDGTSWWYQQGNTASGASYAEGSYYIGPGNWGYQYTEW